MKYDIITIDEISEKNSMSMIMGKNYQIKFHQNRELGNK